MRSLKSKINQFLKDPDLIFVLKLISIWLLSLLLISFLSYSLLNTKEQSFIQFLSKVLSSWDGGNFLEIAKKGYTNNDLIVFFPLYPVLIRVFFFLNPIFIGIIINLSCLILGLYFLTKLLKDHVDKNIIYKTLIYLLIFPTSFYFISLYSESLFFLLSVLTFYLYHKKQTKWAILAAILSSLTRFSGIIVALLLVIESFRSKNPNRFYTLFSFSGILLYALYNYLLIGNFFALLSAESEWGRGIAFPGFPIVDSLIFISKNNFQNIPIMIYFDLLFISFGLGIILRSFRILKLEFSLYGLFSILLPLCTSVLISVPRFLNVMFPIFYTIATIKTRLFHLVYIFLSLGFLIFFWVRFNLGHWVA
jgi:Gpi18-like mannosyltransferase